ncbi:MAG: type II toxin-antitoxin system HicA family toxin [Nitrospinae bacterium]|nr:type II toxin-antitoxin system HicA family toxin [Nitrospinota bacterium]
MVVDLMIRYLHEDLSTTVSGKPSVDVPPGTLNSVLKQAGLK